VSGAALTWVAQAEAIAALRARLGEILIDCVGDGASIGFLNSLDRRQADAYWERVERAAGAGRCLLIVGARGDAGVDGTVQLDLDTPPNQPHRATVSKLLVHTQARRRGLGEALMARAEAEARSAGRWLLTLDTATGEAERLYERLGWRRAGAIPDYAMNPDGSLTQTTFYWKRLEMP